MRPGLHVYQWQRESAWLSSPSAVHEPPWRVCAHVDLLCAYL